jgi:hypothetical protein
VFLKKAPDLTIGAFLIERYFSDTLLAVLCIQTVTEDRLIP